MREFMDIVRSFDTYIILGLTCLFLILVVYTVVLSRRIARLNRRREAKFAEGSVGEITNWLTEHSEAISSLRGQFSTMQSIQTSQGKTLLGCFQRAGIVRFNAFEDVGGEQSLALVLLDANGNGVAISNIYGRQDSRIYAKGIINGEGERPLSDEERRALTIALSGEGLSAGVPTTAGR